MSRGGTPHVLSARLQPMQLRRGPRLGEFLPEREDGGKITGVSTDQFTSEAGATGAPEREGARDIGETLSEKGPFELGLSG